MDIQEIVRRIRAGQSDRAIHDDLGVHRSTLKKYRQWSEENNLLADELPDLETLQQLLDTTLSQSQPPQNVSGVEPYREIVERLREEGVEIKAIHQRLQERGYTGHYQSVWRFVRRLEGPQTKATVRVERPPAIKRRLILAMQAR
jgi:transposase